MSWSVFALVSRTESREMTKVKMFIKFYSIYLQARGIPFCAQQIERKQQIELLFDFIELKLNWSHK